MAKHNHKGITLEEHGSRWRFRVRVAGRVRVVSQATLGEAILALEKALTDRGRLAAEQAVRGLGGVSVASLCRRWFEHARAGYTPGGQRNYETAIRLHIGPSPLGSMDANVVTAQDLRSFYATLRFSPAKKAHQVLRHAYRWGGESVPELVRRDNPALDVAPVRRGCIGHDAAMAFDDEEIRPVSEKSIPTPDEIQKLLVDAEAWNLEWWLYLMLAVGTGARPGEVCALQRHSIDESKGVIRIEWSADRVSGRIKRPKTTWSIRTIPLPASFFEAIAHALPGDRDAFLFRPHHASPMPCWNGRGAYRRLMAALKRTGLPHYTPHAFRHYYATRLLAEGESPVQVARRLGHRDDTLVRKLYGGHIDDEAQRRLAERSMRHLFGWSD